MRSFVKIIALVTGSTLLWLAPDLPAAPQAVSTGAPATQPLAASAPATPRENTYIHPGTKFPFPAKLAGFTRVEVTKYAADESDVSAGYNCDDPANHIAVTVYVFPAPALSTAPTLTPEAAKARQFDQALAAVKKEIANFHADAKLISEAPFTLNEGGRSHPGTKVSYEMSYTFGTRQEETTSNAMLFITGKWQIEYRITYPKATAKAVRPVIDKLLASLTWSAP